MSAAYRAFQWNWAKIRYDAVLLIAVAAYIALFMAAGRWWLSPANNPASWEDLRIRAFGSCAFIMLTIILAIGPLARLDRRALPLLYNRRHFGVLTFCIAAAHGWFNLDWFLSRGRWHDFVAVVTDWPSYASITHFPFSTLGIVSLIVLFLMAATSHDFWLAFLKPPLWKALHMAVYVAYGLLVAHIALGAMQSYGGALIPILLGGAAATVAILHIVAGWREWAVDRVLHQDDRWIPVGPPLAIDDGAARVVSAPCGERIAVFRDGGRIAALGGLCPHQNGPIGEGRIIDGYVTCPWHGHQFRLEDGCAPSPYTDRIQTYRLRLRQGIVEVDPTAALPHGACAALQLPRAGGDDRDLAV